MSHQQREPAKQRKVRASAEAQVHLDVHPRRDAWRAHPGAMSGLVIGQTSCFLGKIQNCVCYEKRPDF